MALVGGYEDSGVTETYPRRRATVTGAASGGANVPAPGVLENSPGHTGPVSPTGGGSPVNQPPPPAAPNYQTLGQYGNKLRGYDMTKFSQPYDQWSEKYKIGAVQSWFDPMQGVSGDYLKALNSLGLADFYGGGGSLGVTNSKNDPRFGKGGIADVVYGYKGQNADTAWQPWYVDENPQPAAPVTSATSQPGLEDLFKQLVFQPQAPAPGLPPGSVTYNSGIDPQTLAVLFSMLQPQQQAPAPQAPQYQPNTQAPAPAPTFTGAQAGGGQALQTQNAAPPVAPGMDPFMAWLRNQVFSGGA